MNEFFNPIDPLPKVWDPNARICEMLKGKRGLVAGIANEHSVVVFLAGGVASGMTGDTIFVDGGLHIVA